MLEPMTVWAEVWPVAADTVGLWLISGDDAWRSKMPIGADSEPHFEAEMLILGQNPRPSVSILHSTSWRPDGPRIILTYIAVVQAGEFVRDEWPAALPISDELLAAVGPQQTNPATDPPLPRYVDVLFHAIRHLRFLQEYDATAADALPARWKPHLDKMEPTLAGLFSHPHGPLPSPWQRVD